MLFLAVFCGFLAENQREHLIEKRREREYIKSFSEDVKQDAVQLKKIIDTIDKRLLYKDSFLIALANPEVFRNSAKAYHFMTVSFHFPDFIYNDRTIQQLKNSGGMRLIRNKAVSDSIMDYDSKVRRIFIHQEIMNSLSLTFALQSNKLFHKRLLDSVGTGNQGYPIPLLSSDKVDREEFYNNMTHQRTDFVALKELATDLLERGKRLIEFVKKQYHMK